MIPSGQEVREAALQSLAAAGQDLVDTDDLDAALGVLAAAAASGVGATLAVIRVAEQGDEDLQARGVWAASPALRAELEGSRIAAGTIGSEELTDRDDFPRRSAGSRAVGARRAC